MDKQRRRILKNGTGFLALGGLLGLSSKALLKKEHNLKRDPEGVLDLHPGFQYKILQKSGDTMTDGYPVPGRPDGMATFSHANGDIILMRNHELTQKHDYHSPIYASSNRQFFYHENGYGGVSRLVLDKNTLKVKSSNLILAGTSHNCSGGVSPFGYISCEESTEENHGYAFLCNPQNTALSKPVKLPFLGRFRHEAYAYDETSHISYLTEDRHDGCFYRYVPKDPQKPLGAGTLQALRVKDKPQFNSSLDMPKNTSLAIDWVDIDQPDPEGDTVRLEAASKGAGTFSRGEGLWPFENQMFFAATNGGAFQKGQIFRVTNGESLDLICESESQDALDHPDNITVAPWGDLILAEDGADSQYLRLLTRKGHLVTLAKNALSRSEFAGVTFSPDGKSLFVNLQSDGLTMAITGPFLQTASMASKADQVWSKMF